MANVLIVDDNTELAELTARVVAAAGHQVQTADTGATGLRSMEHTTIPDCVILDVEMPVLTGPEMVRAMFRHDAGLEKVPIVLVSGRADLPEIAARVGTPYFLSKGASNYTEVLVSLLTRALRERTAPDAAAAS